MNRSFLRNAPLLLLALACAAPPEAGESARRGLARLPADVEQRGRVDFGGAVELLAFEVEPKGTATPGSTVRARLYFRSNKRLSEEWQIFPELRDPSASEPVAEATGGASPGDWAPGNIYLEERELRVPADTSVPVLSLVLGFRRDPIQVEGREVEGLSTLRLPVLSGLTDGEQRAVLSRLSTGVRPGEKRQEKMKKKRPDRRRPTGDRPSRPTRTPRPALSALRRILPRPPAEAAPDKAP
jgi:hypothetical protein